MNRFSLQLQWSRLCHVDLIFEFVFENVSPVASPTWSLEEILLSLLGVHQFIPPVTFFCCHIRKPQPPNSGEGNTALLLHPAPFLPRAILALPNHFCTFLVRVPYISVLSETLVAYYSSCLCYPLPRFYLNIFTMILLQFPRPSAPNLAVHFQLLSTFPIDISSVCLVGLIVGECTTHRIKSTTTITDVCTWLRILRADNYTFLKKVWIFSSEVVLPKDWSKEGNDCSKQRLLLRALVYLVLCLLVMYLNILTEI